MYVTYIRETHHPLCLPPPTESYLRSLVNWLLAGPALTPAPGRAPYLSGARPHRSAISLIKTVRILLCTAHPFPSPPSPPPRPSAPEEQLRRECVPGSGSTYSADFCSNTAVRLLLSLLFPVLLFSCPPPIWSHNVCQALQPHRHSNTVGA